MDGIDQPMDEPRGIQLPKRIGRYDVVAELGRGGMGVVYRAEDKLIGRDVAIKTLTEATPELRERFYVEARSGILNHPNIVTVYELGEDEGKPFIAMEFLPGDSLDGLLRSRSRLPVDEAISIVEQLCAGIGYAHYHGLVHRDVKPANIIVLPDGRAKIVDFGIAHLAEQTTRLTQTDALLGTFHYIAPERFSGQPSDGRSDIWSIGVMLFEMITGELPFKGKDASAMYRVMHEAHRPIGELAENVPDGLAHVIDRALEKRAEDRYASAEEMGSDLQAISEGLHKQRVGDLLVSGQRLVAAGQLTSARTALLQALKLDSGNAQVRALLAEVQGQLGALLRSEQLRQVVDQAETAATARQYDDAIQFLGQAIHLDTGDTLALGKRLDEVRLLKERALRVRSFCEQAQQARSRGDLLLAQEILGKALELDSTSTDLRNAHAIVQREIRSEQQSREMETFLRAARGEMSARRYTGAIATLHEAAAINPTQQEVQQLLFEAVTGQKEERRRTLLEKVVAEIEESLDADDLDRAQDQVSRALDTLPTETALLAIASQIEERRREAARRQLVHQAVLGAQELLSDDPESALRVIDVALEQDPGDVDLLGFRLRLEEHLATLHREREEARLLEQGTKVGDSLSTQPDGAVPVAAEATPPDDRVSAEVAPASTSSASSVAKHNAFPSTTSQQKTSAESHTTVLKVIPKEAGVDRDRNGGGDVRSARAITTPRSRKPSWIAGGVGFALLLPVAAWLAVHFAHRTAKVAPVVTAPMTQQATATPASGAAQATPIATTFMQINASPWATVVAVTRQGSDVQAPLPDGDSETPLRLDGVAPGSYTITLRDANSVEHGLQCSLDQVHHLCTAEFAAPDINLVLQGARP